MFGKLVNKIKLKFTQLKVETKTFKALTTVQVRDKIDFSWTKSFKKIIQKIVFFILKFGGIAGVVYLMLFVLGLLIGMKAELIKFYFIFLAIFLVLNLLTVTFGLMKTLYYAEDNKVLVTYPISSSGLFISKIVVYLIFELKKSFDLLLPISFGFIICGIAQHALAPITLLWSLLPIFSIVVITVLLGSLLSIPCLYLYKLIIKNTIVEFSLLAVVVVALIFGLVKLINIIPPNKGDISLVNQLYIIKAGISSFIDKLARILPPIKFAFRAIVGETSDYVIGGVTFGKFGIMIGVIVLLFIIDVLLIKPFYFTMMTKTFEFEKSTVVGEKENNVRKQKIAFIGKELKLVFRDIEISGSYLCVYILTPILLLFIDRIFLAMDIDYRGKMIGFAINFALILLPLLASSTIVSTVYSREGRAAYIKKTKPVKPYFLLTSKLIFNLVLCIPSIICCGIVFRIFSGLNAFCIILLILTVLGFQYGHIFFSASLDLMNPQNELYATEGTVINNSNEIKSTIVAFFVAILVAALSYLFFTESFDPSLKLGGEIGNLYNMVFIKLLIISLIFAISMFTLFILKIKAFYIDRQEASRE